jgi:hypothetical protein
MVEATAESRGERARRGAGAALAIALTSSSGSNATATYDGAYTELRPLICVPGFAGVAREAQGCTGPPASLVFTVNRPRCPWEIAHYLRRGRARGRRSVLARHRAVGNELAHDLDRYSGHVNSIGRSPRTSTSSTSRASACSECRPVSHVAAATGTRLGTPVSGSLDPASRAGRDYAESRSLLIAMKKR